MQHQSDQRKTVAVSQRRPDGWIYYVVGTTGCGKTTWVRQQVQSARRLLVWDGKEEWGARDRCKVVTSPHELARYIMPGAPPARIAYRVPVSREAFNVFCALTWVALRANQCTLVVEELADVTTPSKAPLSWGEICRKSRGYGAMVYALTQRPQEVDKTLQGNAAVYHCGMMADSLDARYVARRLACVPDQQVIDLQPYQWIERNVRRGVTTTGMVRKSRK